MPNNLDELRQQFLADIDSKAERLSLAEYAELIDDLADDLKMKAEAAQIDLENQKV